MNLSLGRPVWKAPHISLSLARYSMPVPTGIHVSLHVGRMGPILPVWTLLLARPGSCLSETTGHSEGTRHEGNLTMKTRPECGVPTVGVTVSGVH